MWDLFLQESIEWWHVVRHMWTRFLGSFLVLVLLVLLLQLALFGVFSVQSVLGMVSDELSIVLDIREGLGEEEIRHVLDDVALLKGVSEVRFLSSNDALSFVDAEVLPGYSDFLLKNRLKVPFSPVVLLRVEDVSLLGTLKTDILASYSNIFEDGYGETDVAVASFAGEALSLGNSIAFAGKLLVLVFAFLLSGVFSLFLWFVLESRKHEFHLVHFLGFPTHYHHFSFLFMGLFLGLIMFLCGYLLFLALSGVFGPLFVWQLLSVFFLSVVVSELAYRK